MIDPNILLILHLLIIELSQIMQTQRKLVQLFKNFVERALLPLIKNNDAAVQQWNKFSNMISYDNINYPEIKLYIDTLQSPINLSSFDRKKENSPQNFRRIQQKSPEQMLEQQPKFNPYRTVGGQRDKMKLFPLKNDPDESSQNSIRQTTGNKSKEAVQTAFQKNGSYSSGGLNLEQLFQNALQNQKKIEGICGVSINNNSSNARNF